jgi:hypothetical protein
MTWLRSQILDGSIRGCERCPIFGRRSAHSDKDWLGQTGHERSSNSFAIEVSFGCRKWRFPTDRDTIVRMGRSWLLLALLVGCKESPADRSSTPVTRTVTSVECALPPGVSPNASDKTVIGPEQCSGALQRWMDGHSEARIVSLVGIDEVDPPQGNQQVREVHAGTQRLLVVHADGGPWPLARELVVDYESCVDEMAHSAATDQSKCFEQLKQQAPSFGEVFVGISDAKPFKGSAGTSHMIVLTYKAKRPSDR